MSLRIAAAAALLTGGALHARLAFDSYGTADLITLFFLNALGSALVVAWIVYDRTPFALMAGLGVSTVSLLAFGLSRVGGGVVGFRGVGLEPGPDALLTLVAEGLAVLLLAVALLRERHQLVAVVHQLRRSEHPAR
jgi:hypothetical protein